MLKLLFVEDDPLSIELAKEKCQEELGARCDVKDFAEAEAWIADNPPDIVILDLLRGSFSEPEVAGQTTYEFIWKKQFCPIIIYSARPDAETEKRSGHPFVRNVQKGSGSPAKVVSEAKELQPHVEAIRTAEGHIRQSFSRAMRDVAPDAFRNIPGNLEERKQVILRAGRRRVAALMDDLSESGEKLASWEHYIWPPISDDIKLGDVLKLSDGHVENPCAFFVVLTPSCDLVNSGGRTPKVKTVLVACCCSMKDGLNLTAMKGVNPSKLRDRLPPLLSQGFFETIIPFSCLEGKIPTMAANLKNLILIPFEEIGGPGKKYVRIASIDSPFRELVSWAYLQIACRPGLPDRDVDSWCSEIVDKMQSGSTTE